MAESTGNNKFPWESSMTTKELLLQLVRNSDETEKVDFKLDFNLQSSKSDKNELLLDMACIANSYSSDYDNHGFLILGIDPDTKEIKGTDVTKEGLTTHIDERMVKFLSPHIRFTVELYDTEDGIKKWGAIIIKSVLELPHIFITDTGEFKRGEVWVRKGSHKCPADPTDFSRFYAIRTESLKRGLDQLETKMNLQENDLKKRIEAIEKKYKKLPPVSKTLPAHQKGKDTKVIELEPAIPEYINQSSQDDQDLLSLVKKELPKHSPLESSLLKEVQAGIVFLESDEIPWTLRIGESNKQEAFDVLQKIQSKFENYYKALLELAFFSDKKEHLEVIINSVQKLARYIHKGGVPYEALYVRYLPLVTTLYIVSIATVYRNNPDLLKRVIALDLFNKDRYEGKHSITDALFFIRSASEVFDALHTGYPRQKWCDGVGTYLKQYFSSMLANYDEFQDPEALFYQGEFLLTLTPVIAVSKNGLTIGHISAGSYMFYNEAQHILEEFLQKNKVFFEKIFDKNLKAVLENFDEYAPKMGNRGGCWADGIPQSVTKILFPQATTIKTN